MPRSSMRWAPPRNSRQEPKRATSVRSSSTLMLLVPPG